MGVFTLCAHIKQKKIPFVAGTVNCYKSVHGIEGNFKEYKNLFELFLNGTKYFFLL